MIFSFLALFHVLQRTFLIFQLFHFSLPYFTFYSVGFSFSTFSDILPYSRSYSVHSSFFRFLKISRHISLPKDCYSHFLWFSVFSTYSRSYSVHFSFFSFFNDFVIFQVLKCVFLIFHDFQFSLPYFMS
jgi:ABC-type dipeptide/oligopeptide/nickel transport system permease component